MHMRRLKLPRPPLVLVVVASLFGAGVYAAATRPPFEPMADAAAKFVAALSPEQAKLASFAWDDPARMQWHYVPQARTGLPLKKMNGKQRALALGLVQTGLSRAGYDKASQIIGLERFLAAIENDPVKRDPELYYLWVFGKPDANGTWGWKLEGHHLSLNFTIVKGAVLSTTPAFMGANPGEVRVDKVPGLWGRRVLGAEEDLGRALVTSFDERTRKAVVFQDVAPKEIVTGAAAKVDPLAPAGLPAAAFSEEGKKMLRRLLGEYAAAMPEAVAKDRLARIEKAGFDKVFFAWAGGLRRGEPHYYRIQGPTFLVEYDNTQNDANHVHSVWRDFSGDFGRDLLREHVGAAAH